MHKGNFSRISGIQPHWRPGDSWLGSLNAQRPAAPGSGAPGEGARPHAPITSGHGKNPFFTPTIELADHMQEVPGIGEDNLGPGIDLNAGIEEIEMISAIYVQATDRYSCPRSSLGCYPGIGAWPKYIL